MTLSPATRAAQALCHVDPTTGGISPAIDLSATFVRDGDYAARGPYIYARDGGPTVRQAEAVLADLDGAADSLVFASGMAAITTLIESLEPGAGVVAPSVMYHGGRSWLQRQAARGRIDLCPFDPSDQSTLAAAVTPATRLIWIETPVNPTWDILDIAAAARVAKASGANLAVDCTAAPPTTLQALSLGADIAFHSGTKYLGGHSDLTAGVLSTADPALGDTLRALRTLMGTVIGAFEAWLLIRGLRTLFLRWERASTTALDLARTLSQHPKVETVLYPGLETHPGHSIARAQMVGGFGGMLSLLVDTPETAARVVRQTKLWLPATSLGGVESLIEHRHIIEAGIDPRLLRLSTGIEAPEDLLTDLVQALDPPA
ncbi:MAG: PLP-dependent aspartate aminotransferase family protein [Pseudomonadota bacterium]